MDAALGETRQTSGDRHLLVKKVTVTRRSNTALVVDWRRWKEGRKANRNSEQM